MASTASLWNEFNIDLELQDMILSPSRISLCRGSHFEIIIGRLCSLPPLIEIPKPLLFRFILTSRRGEDFS